MNKNFFFLFNFFLFNFFLFYKFFFYRLRKIKYFFFKKKNNKIKLNIFLNLKIRLKTKKIIKFKKFNIFFFEKNKGIHLKNIYKKIKRFYKIKKKFKKIKKFKKNFKKKRLFINNFYKKIKIFKKKKKRNRVFSVKKNFKKIKKINLLSIKKKFSFFKINRNKLGLLFKSIQKKSFFEMNASFMNSIINILTFFFFFLNKTVIKFLIKKKLIFLNFKHLKNFYINLKNGDFLQFVHIKVIIKFLKF
jgi:hypothetical protein